MTRHPLSIVGSVLVTLSAFLFIFVLLIDALGLHSNPYFGLMFFVVLPLIFVIGLIMIPLGIVFERRRREQGLPPREAIRQAANLRFRPILMTTMAALLGALPLMLSWGVGSELRRPLGIAMVGGLIFSQLLTIFTTPVIYLYFDRWAARWRRRIQHTEPRADVADEGANL